MLNSKEFDLWANSYENEVGISDKNNEYPFAGYGKLLSYVYGTVIRKNYADILDVGIGTGSLAFKLYDKGYSITGIDFSSEMLDQARARMPSAKLIQCDFSKGLPNELKDVRFDFIISTYALHHLPDSMKIELIKTLMAHLNKSGMVIYGDVMFSNRAELEKCKHTYPDEWDDNEYPSVSQELYENLQSHYDITYRSFSFCSGLLEVMFST